MEDLLRLGEVYGLKTLTVYKTRYYFTLKAREGDFRLIPTAISEAKAQDIFKIKESLYSCGVDNIHRIVLTEEGNALFTGEEGNYILTEEYKGNQPELEDKGGVIAAFGCLGKIHRALRDIKREGSLIEDYERGLKKLKDIKKRIGRIKKPGEIDLSFLKYYNDFYEQGSEAVENLRALGFKVSCPIHGACKEDNFILRGDRIWLTDWEMCHNGHFMEDLAQLTLRYARKVAVSGEPMPLELLLNAYLKENPCNHKEIAIFYALMLYPYRFISLCNKYCGMSKKFTPRGVRDKFNEVVLGREKILKYIKEG